MVILKNSELEKKKLVIISVLVFTLNGRLKFARATTPQRVDEAGREGHVTADRLREGCARLHGERRVLPGAAGSGSQHGGHRAGVQREVHRLE